ncbi:MAG: WG repeat-containing protein, partial [Chitinophagaceae bacterium]|nr:WG repeat-containing protein [Chitinophagaceae bacterium]
EIVIPFIYENVGDFNEGYASFLRDGKYGFIDVTGKEIIKPTYHYAWSFHEGLAAIEMKNEKNENVWGFINTNGKIVLPLIYSSILPQYNRSTHKVIMGFDKGKAYISSFDFNSFYINKKGEKISD